MRDTSKLQIYDLELIESGVEQEITLEEAEKIVGGKKKPKPPNPPNPPKNPPVDDPPGWDGSSIALIDSIDSFDTI